MSEDLQWLTSHVLWAESGGALRASTCGCDPLPTPLAMARTVRYDTHHGQSGSVAHYLGRLSHVLDRYDEADLWFTEALACHEGMEAPFFVAYTQTAWAALLIDRNQPGDGQRARTLLSAALPVATEGGYGYVERDARDLLERIGVDSSTWTKTCP